MSEMRRQKASLNAKKATFAFPISPLFIAEISPEAGMRKLHVTHAQSRIV
jgi:hypothetical protein